MPPRNTLRDDDNVQQPIDGDVVVETETHKFKRILDSDGNIRHILTDSHSSRPDENGVYRDISSEDILTDRFGNPFPKDLRKAMLSHTGLPIESPEKMASCTSRLH